MILLSVVLMKSWRIYFSFITQCTGNDIMVNKIQPNFEGFFFNFFFFQRGCLFLVLTAKNSFLYLQLVLEEVSVLVEKIRKQINPCTSARGVTSMTQPMCPRMRKSHPIDGRRTRNTDSSSWLVSDGLCDAEEVRQ